MSSLLRYVSCRRMARASLCVVHRPCRYRRGGIGTSVCLPSVTFLIHTLRLEVVSVSVHLLAFIELLSALLVVKTLPRFTCTIVESRWRFVCWVVLCGRRSCSELSTWWASDCLELARLRLRSTMSAFVLYMLGAWVCLGATR